MQVHEKRKLLIAIDTLVKRPMAADENTLGEAIGYFTLLIEELTQGQLTIHAVEKKCEHRFSMETLKCLSCGKSIAEFQKEKQDEQTKNLQQWAELN